MASDDHFDPEQSHHPDPAMRRHTIMKQFGIALADFRLGRAYLLWPCAAAVIEAAFTLIDPAGVQFLGEDPEAATEYRGVAARVWNEVCLGLVRSLQGESGELEPDVDENGKAWASIDRDEVHRIVVEALTDEFATSKAVSLDTPTLFDLLDDAAEDDEAERRMWRDFADIVAREFDEQVETAEVPVDPVVSVEVDTMDPIGFISKAAIDRVVDLIHGRIGVFPMGTPGGAD